MYNFVLTSLLLCFALFYFVLSSFDLPLFHISIALYHILSKSEKRKAKSKTSYSIHVYLHIILCKPLKKSILSRIKNRQNVINKKGSAICKAYNMLLLLLLWLYTLRYSTFILFPHFIRACPFFLFFFLFFLYLTFSNFRPLFILCSIPCSSDAQIFVSLSFFFFRFFFSRQRIPHIKARRSWFVFGLLFLSCLSPFASLAFFFFFFFPVAWDLKGEGLCCVACCL